MPNDDPRREQYDRLCDFIDDAALAGVVEAFARETRATVGYAVWESGRTVTLKVGRRVVLRLSAIPSINGRFGVAGWRGPRRCVSGLVHHLPSRCETDVGEPLALRGELIGQGGCQGCSED